MSRRYQEAISRRLESTEKHYLDGCSERHRTRTLRWKGKNSLGKSTDRVSIRKTLHKAISGTTPNSQTSQISKIHYITDNICRLSGKFNRNLFGGMQQIQNQLAQYFEELLMSCNLCISQEQRIPRRLPKGNADGKRPFGKTWSKWENLVIRRTW